MASAEDQSNDGRTYARVSVPDDTKQFGQVLAVGAGVFRVNLGWVHIILPIALIVLCLLCLRVVRRCCRPK